MKIIVNSLDLNDAVSKVSKALPVRDVAPVLECIKITAENDQLTLFATDKDLAIEKTIEANVIVGGATLAPGKVLAEYIRNIAGSDVEISLETTDEGKLTISSSGSECTVSTLDIDDYPENEQVDDAHYFTIQEVNLKEIINNVIFSVATDDSRPMLKGVYFEADGYVLTAVATDGYRFAMSKKALEEKTEKITATVPSRSLSELAKLLGDSENLLKVYVEKNYLLVSLPNTKLLTRLLVSGQYIRYDNIIPRDFVSTLLVNKENFEKSLSTASIMSRGDKNNLVVLDIEEYNMTISSTSQYGTARENVAISLSGKDVRCAYNAKYINDCLKVISAETIKMEFAQHSSCVITINNSDEVLYFILPVKQIS
ncbi:MAG: DNA polymerase III subunit beta [Candidatus Fimimonas sp.]